MTNLLNTDIDNINSDYELSYQNTNDGFIDEIKHLFNNINKLYINHLEEQNKLSKQLNDVNNKVNERREILKHKIEENEYEQHILKTENKRLESINNECRLLEIEENGLKEMINETKTQLNQVSKEKKEKIKKLKKEINCFKNGVKTYEQFLQLNLSVSGQNKTLITMKNLKNNPDFTVVFEENDNDFNLIDIAPRSQTVMKAAALYRENKDIQGLLAFLCLGGTNKICV